MRLPYPALSDGQVIIDLMGSSFFQRVRFDAIAGPCGLRIPIP
jgi:hypothetical protein